MYLYNVIYIYILGSTCIYVAYKHYIYILLCFTYKNDKLYLT